MAADEVTSYSTPAIKESVVRRMQGVRGYPYRDFDYDIIV
jgi:hypothetical protein